MDNYRKIFSEGLNADDDFSIISKGQWINASGIRTFTTDNGATGRIEAVGGSSLLFDTLPTGTNKCIGGVSDEANKRIVFFNYNSNGDYGIYCYDKTTATTYTVLLDDNVTGGLNFSKYHRIHSCFIVNGYYYWVNGTQNQPRRICIEAGIKAYHSSFTTTQRAYTLPVTQSVISWARKPGAMAPTFSKVTQTDPVVQYNAIKDSAFQFYYRYNYIGGETSVLSPPSTLANYNSENEVFNRIDVTIPLSETIDQDVLSIDLVVKYADTKNYFIIHTWNKSIVQDLMLVAAHVNGTTPLTYQFFNNTTGEALDDAYTAKYFESIPIYAETTELADNRAHLGNYTIGYNSPKTTSLTVSYETEEVSTTDPATITGEWFRLRFRLVQPPPSPPGTDYEFYVLRTDTPLSVPATPAAVYYWAVTGTIPPFPDTVSEGDMTLIGTTTTEIINYYRRNVIHNTSWLIETISLVDQTDSSTITSASIRSDLIGKFFKSAASYMSGITFYDQYQRKCGVTPYRKVIEDTVIYGPVTVRLNFDAASNTISIPATEGTELIQTGYFMSVGSSVPNEGVRGVFTVISSVLNGLDYIIVVDEDIEETGSFLSSLTVQKYITELDTVDIPEALISDERVRFLTWGLSNNLAYTEIPSWAWYYSVNITKTLSTRFFMYGAGLASYGSKGDDGTYAPETTYTSDRAAILLDVSSLNTFNMGYSFNEGDVCKIAISGTLYSLAVLGQQGKYVALQPKDIGTLSPSYVVYELYTPYKRTDAELFYETGELFPVDNPETDERAYSRLSGNLAGDVYLFKRGYSTVTFIAEAMSINDKFWQNWLTDAGRPNIIETIGQKVLETTTCFSNVFIQGSKVNGLSSFEALNDKTLGTENGAIRKLQLANKIQTDGTVMLAICENECVSMYLGEQEIFDTQGSAFIAKSSGVIGTTKSLNGSMGTQNPESVFEYNGQVFWWDIRSACAVQYSGNGLYPISKNKFVRPAKLFSKKYSSMSVSDIETLGSNPYIIGGYDPYHNEVLFSIPSTEATPPKGYLVDYPEVVYPYDIYDGQGKTLVYKHNADVWMGSFPFEAEHFVKMDDDLYAFKDGKLYIQNDTAHPCKFFGVQYTAKLMYSNNPGAIHTFLSMGLESNKVPSWVHFRTEDPYTQSSDLISTDLISRQGVIEASLFRDRLSPNATGDYDAKQMKGDRLFGKALLTTLEYEFVTDTSKLELRGSDIGHIINQGTIINK